VYVFYEQINDDDEEEYKLTKMCPKLGKHELSRMKLYYSSTM